MQQNFNSRPHEEVDGAVHVPVEEKRLFQLTTSRRGRLSFTRFPLTVYKFQLTTSRRGRRFDLTPNPPTSSFQLTTSRRGRHTIRGATFCGTDISTHDLTKRSTRFDNSSISCLEYFNSRPHEEVDFAALLYECDRCIFQLTTSRRGRRQFLRKKFSFPNYFLCLLHIIYSYYINTIFFSTLFFAKSSFFLVRIP